MEVGWDEEEGEGGRGLWPAEENVHCPVRGFMGRIFFSVLQKHLDTMDNNGYALGRERNRTRIRIRKERIEMKMQG